MTHREEDIFLQSIRHPADGRTEFVREACGNDTALRDRVLELLAAHEDGENLLEQRPPGVGEGNVVAETVESPAPQVEPRRTQVAVQPRKSHRVSAAFAESTRNLLRRRLTIAAMVLLAVEAVFILGTIVFTDRPGFDIAIRLAVSAVLSLLLVQLRKNTEQTVTTLRLIELGVLAMPVVEIIGFLVFHTEHMATEARFDDITILRSLVGMGSCVVISLYGMFIPSHWQRTAIVAGIVACIPTITILIHTLFNPLLRQPEAVRLDAAIPVFLLTATIAAIATLGAHVVHQIRREVEAARQYGQYEIGRQIGAGGMGVVYEAEHRMLKRPAAIKLIRPEAAADDRAIENFEREVQISATLSHWNTIQIYDYGRSEDGEFFYVMELLKGLPLDDHIRRKRTLTVAETITIVQQICAGLEEAHAIGMVHRDLKPANVFLAEYGGHHGVVKVLDFGLAVHSSIKPQKTVSGTPNYMSPEQVLGEGVDGRSDIYAIGCIMFECLSGAPPFLEFNTERVLNKQLIALPPMHEIPKTAQVLSPIVSKCLAKNRSDRYATVTSLSKALTDLDADAISSSEGTN